MKSVRSLAAVVVAALATAGAAAPAAAAPMRVSVMVRGAAGALRADAAGQRRLDAVARRVGRLGGRLESVDRLTGTVVARLPASGVRRLRRHAWVATIERAAAPRPLTVDGLEVLALSVGAPTAWAAGFRGGHGSADTTAVDYGIVGEDIVEADHPAFSGVTFQRPAGAASAPPCGQSTSGCEHGTAVASVAISRGAGGCGFCTADDGRDLGVAPALDSVLDAGGVTAPFDPYSWLLGIAQTRSDTMATLPGAADPAEIIHGSSGVAPDGAEDDAATRRDDLIVATLGTLVVHAAGNAGPASATVQRPCTAYNVLCVGAVNAAGSDHSADSIPSYATRGPTPVTGRKKPDLVAPGQTLAADQQWIRFSRLWRSEEGSSIASAAGAGAAAVVLGAGVGDPLAVRALLINSARRGRATAPEAMGTQAGWQPDWGWGELDLAAAVAQRAQVLTASLGAGDVRLFRATGVTAGGRATLVWNRHIGSCTVLAGCTAEALPLGNLDLAEYDAATDAVLSSSASTVDNVEQTRSPGAAGVVYKVRAGSALPAANEPFALATSVAAVAVAAPRPAVTIEAAPRTLRAGQEGELRATIANRSTDLAAGGATVMLALLPGLEFAPGSAAATQTVGTLAPAGQSGSSATVTWTIRGTGDGPVVPLVFGTTSRFGESFSDATSGRVVVDVTAPVPAISVPETSEPGIAVSWSATDPGSGIADYDVEAATDGGEFAPWQTATQATGATFAGSAGHRYHFRVRARDAFGNVSPFVVSAPVAVSAGTSGTVRLTPVLRLTALRVKNRRLIVTGRLSPKATGRLLVRAAGRVGRRKFDRSRQVTALHGHFTARLPLPAGRPLRGTLRVRYPGDARFRARTLRSALPHLP